MQAYNKTLLENTELLDEANSLAQADFINKEQLILIEKQLPVYQKTNPFARVGLFILGCFLFTSCCSVFAVATLIGGSSNYAWIFIVYTIFGFVALEFIIRRWKYFGNGIDDAFLYCAEISLLLAVGFMIGELDHLAPVFLMTGLIGLVCSYRYVDRFSTFLACFGFTTFVGYVFFQMGEPFRSLLPFILMILGVFFYLVFIKLKRDAKEINIYSKNLNVLYVFALLLFYIGGNYFVVREASVQLMNSYLEPGEDIPFAFLFYGFTCITPLLYIFFGLKNKDRILLWSGIVCVFFSILTIRQYYHVLPTEIALLLGGGILFLIAFLSMTKLKAKTKGLTFEPDRFTSTDTLGNAEVLALLQRYAVKPVGSNSNDVEAGGGEFGGAGSGGNY